MDTGFNYEPSIISFNGNAASKDHSPDLGDHATDGVEEGSFSPTTVHPTKGPVFSEGKDLSNHNQDCNQAGSQHDKGSPSECSSRHQAVRPGEANPGSHHSGTPSISGGRNSAATLAKDMGERPVPTSSTICSQSSLADADGHNLEFPFL